MQTKSIKPMEFGNTLSILVGAILSMGVYVWDWLSRLPLLGITQPSTPITGYTVIHALLFGAIGGVGGYLANKGLKYLEEKVKKK